MKKIIRNAFNQKLKEDEFILICDILKGTSVNIESLNWENDLILNVLCEEKINSFNWKYGVNSKDLMNKLEKFSTLDKLALLIEVDSFLGKVESDYQALNMISPKNKILEILSNVKDIEAIIWNPEESSINEFYMAFKSLNMDYLIYVQDFTGDNLSIWGTTKKDLIKCFVRFSEKNYYGKIRYFKDINLIES